MAIDEDIGDNPRDHGRRIEDRAALWLARRRQEHAHAVGRTEIELRRKSKVNVASNEEIVTGIVLQFHRVARTNDEPHDSSPNRELWLYASDLNGGNATDNRAGAV